MLNSIEQYYKNRCDGSWEHNFGFTIESCDNPGWMIIIKDPHLYRSVCYLKKENKIPISINISLGNTALSEVILFSQQLHSLSEFVKTLLDNGVGY